MDLKKVWAASAAILVVVCSGTPCLAVGLRFPVIDTERIQFDYVVYADHDPDDGVMTWACLPWCAGTWINRYVECTENYPFCYDGHDGTDFMLIDGFAMMDDGSAQVVAAADGVVIATEDGNYDRCHADIITQDVTCDGHPMRGNYVKIRHADGMETWYWHFKKDSIVVNVDDEVGCGDVLGLIGSSGYSSAPHLHFEVRVPVGDGSTTEWIDPFAGPHSQETSYWVLQYDPTTWLPGAYCEGDEIPDFPEPVGDEGGQVETVEFAEVVEVMDSVESVEPTELVEAVEAVESAETVEAAEVVEPVGQDVFEDAPVDVVLPDVRPDTGMPDSGLLDAVVAVDSVALDSGHGSDTSADSSGGGCHAAGRGQPYGLLLMLAGVIFAFGLRRRGLFR